MYVLYIGSGNCSVDNNNCEHTCTQSDCGCLNGQTLIQTSCLCKLICVVDKQEHYCMCTIL